MTRKVALAFCMLCALAASTNAAVPTSMNVQGKLTDSLGVPVAPGSKQFVFSIHDDPVGGSKIWPAVSLEYQTISTDQLGLWTANVGAIVPLTDLVYADSVRWLEVAVDIGGPVVLPRIRLTTGPYAYRVGTVDGASGGTITSKVSIGSGHTNTGAAAFVSGHNSTVSGDYSTVGGGVADTAEGHYSTIGGGGYNRASGVSSVVSGGFANAALNADAAVVGGYADSAFGYRSFIGGGTDNNTSANVSSVVGGTNNSAAGAGSFIGGGILNGTDGFDAVVSGGSENYAAGPASTIGGGHGNVADAYATTIPGGENNLAHGDYAFAAGRGARAFHSGCFVWKDGVGGSIQTTAPNQFLIYASGGTGIGTTSPYAPLHVHLGVGGALSPGPNTVATFDNSSDHAYISIMAPTDKERGVLFGEADKTADGAIVYDAPSLPSAMQFRTNNNITHMVLTSAGALGIGESFPESHLHVKTGSAGAVSGDGSVMTLESAGPTYLSLFSPNNQPRGIYFGEPGAAHSGGILYDADPANPNCIYFGAGDIVPKVSISATGRLGIGDLSPDAELDVEGSVVVSGTVCAANIACASDARLKRDVRPLSGVLSDVLNLQAVEYSWKEDVAKAHDWSPERQFGLLAQDVRTVAPQAVVEMPDGYLAVDYARLVPLLIEGMKEQQKIIDRQNERIANLEKKLEQ